MTLPDALQALESSGNPRMRAMNLKNGAGENQYGVQMGDIRALAKKIKTDHPLALALWETGNIDAQFLAILLMKPKSLTAPEVERLLGSITFVNVADWFISYILKAHPEKESLRRKWMTAGDPMAGRAAWSLTAERIHKNPEGLDLPALLDRIEAEMADAPEAIRWTMNFALAATGIHHPALRERALAIGEKLGVYRDYPVSKGCTSPFAPIWIHAMVARQG